MKKIALIIGGSSGIGLAVAEKLVENNYKVYNGSRRKCPLPTVQNFFIDVANTTVIKDTIIEILSKENKIDLLVYSAGFSMASPVETVLTTDYNYLFKVNVFGAIESIKAVVPIMKKQYYGHIILISSIASTIPIIYDPYYCASKASLNMLAKTLHAELKQYNIRITSVLPGGTKTAFSYKRKVQTINNKPLNNSVKVLCKLEQKGMEANTVANSIYKITTMSNPPIITSNGLTNKLTVLFDKIVGHKIISKLSAKIFID